ncbi:cytochrome p450 monooxygenase GliC [Pseudovirgaria hyperparasitica]|uniref:Cytochrome p450 monooxygenase GliC n=1 Tax=Pseudovirgaria hyperparasitica TaxID=470096 RepID=A0A6A6W2J2_9PEZI|nr:cytochrome p450 monooxygenase GliC [Pseudovirgaria hyperparasitica]KAF2756234.1 cytochrome p450 monooxygenase GliC [Pseudovirgaria hyperparasitica]
MAVSSNPVLLDRFILLVLPLFCVFILVELRYSYARRFFAALFSILFSTYLHQKYPIIQHETQQPLPSLPFTFPNGQGDTEKFLHGRTNSAKWQNRYGSLYRIWSGQSPEVVLTEARHVEAVFKDSHTHQKAHANDSGQLMYTLLGSCLGLISGQGWKAVRKASEPAFLHRSTLAYTEDFTELTRSWIAGLVDNPEFRDNGRLHPVEDLKLLPFLAVAKVLFGDFGDDLKARLLAIIPGREQLMKYVVKGGMPRFWISQFLPLQANRELKEFKSKWASWTDEAYSRAVENYSGDSFKPSIIDMYSAVAEGTITREEVLQTLDEMLFANLDVTMGGISWNVVFLAAHPSIQEELRNEFGGRAADRNAYLLETNNLLNSCILESSRLRPLAAFSVPQSCPNVRVLDGYVVPPGTKFIVDAYALNIRDPFWGNDREQYRPQRFLERQKLGKDTRYRYWRFGFGPRQCLGKYVADLLIKCLIIELLERYDLRLFESKEAEWPWNDETWIHHPEMVVMCKPREKAIL